MSAEKPLAVLADALTKSGLHVEGERLSDGEEALWKALAVCHREVPAIALLVEAEGPPEGGCFRCTYSGLDQWSALAQGVPAAVALMLGYFEDRAVKALIREEHLASGQVARLLQMSRSTVYRRTSSGLLPSSRTAGGHRRYPTDFLRVLLMQGKSCKEAKDQRRYEAPCGGAVAPP